MDMAEDSSTGAKVLAAGHSKKVETGPGRLLHTIRARSKMALCVTSRDFIRVLWPSAKSLDLAHYNPLQAIGV